MTRLITTELDKLREQVVGPLFVVVRIFLESQFVMQSFPPCLAAPFLSPDDSGSSLL